MQRKSRLGAMFSVGVLLSSLFTVTLATVTDVAPAGAAVVGNPGTFTIEVADNVVGGLNQNYLQIHRPPFTQCSDDVDNDADTQVDNDGGPNYVVADTGCVAEGGLTGRPNFLDNTENDAAFVAPPSGTNAGTKFPFSGPNGPWECQDRGDNDGDGKIDHSSTPAVGTPPRAYDDLCASATDDNEYLAGVQTGDNLTYQASVATNGDITLTSVTLPPVKNTSQGGRDATITYQATGVGDATVDGNINPRTGAITVLLQLRVIIHLASGLNLDFTLGSNSSGGYLQLNLTTGTSSNGSPANVLTGVPYDSSTKQATLVTTGFAMDSMCAGTLCGIGHTPFKQSLGLPSPIGENSVSTKIQSNNAILPGPTANAGADQASVPEGSVVSLGGSASNNVNPTTYLWAQQAGPAVPVVKNATSTSASMVAQDGPASVTMGFTATDSSAAPNVTTDTMAVGVVNVAPTANAGPDQRVTPGTVNLKGTSADPADSEASRTYAWTCTAGPACVDPPDTKTASIGLSTTGTYTFQLSVNDGDGGIGTDTVNVTVVPAAGSTTLSGRVTDSATGATISGATVSIYTNPAGAPVATTGTDGSGNWAWGSAVSLTNYYVKFSNAGMVDTWYRSGYPGLPVLAGNALVDGQTGPARTISGTVTEAVSSALVFTTVRLYDENGWVATASSPGGAFSFTNVPAKNTYRVQVAKGSGSYDMAWYGSAAIGGPTLAGGQATKIDVTGASFTTADVSLYTPAQSGLTGTVNGCVSPATCEGVQVRFYQPTGSGGAWVGTATTNASGVFDMSNLRPGTYRIWFWTKSSGGVPANTSNETSEWYNNLAGEQYQNTGAIADTYTVPTGPGSTIGTYTL